MGNKIRSKNNLNKDDIHAEQRNNIENDIRSENQDGRMSVKNKIIFIISIAVIAVTQIYHLMKLIRTILQ